MTTLSVALPPVRPAPGTAFRYVLSDRKGQLQAEGQAALPLLPRADRLVLVVPARCLSWHRVRLPPVSAARTRAALEGLLEDRLLDEPASLALAMAPARDADGTWRVAACDKDWLAGILQSFEQAGRPAHRVVPEHAPLMESGARRQLVVAGSPQAATLSLVDADGVLQLPLAEVDAVLPPDARGEAAADLVAEPDVASLAASVFGRPATQRGAAQALLASSGGAWNLAQFDLATSRRARLVRRLARAWREAAQGRRWRALRWGLVMALLVNLAGLQAWAWQLERTLDARRQQVRQVLMQTFPKVRTVIDAPLQMERELALLRQTSGALSPRDLETLLSTLGQALPEGLHAQGLEYGAGQLVAKGVALTPEQSAMLAGKVPAQRFVLRQDADRLSLRAAADR